MPNASPAERFFTELAGRGHARLLEGTSGTLLVELGEGEKAPTERWFVTIKRGDVSVSREGPEADCVLWTSPATFEAILDGRLNAFSAMLRGLLEAEGRIHLLVALQALFRPSVGADEQRPAGFTGGRR
jgi:putative sterol carrier protein